MVEEPDLGELTVRALEDRHHLPHPARQLGQLGPGELDGGTHSSLSSTSHHHARNCTLLLLLLLLLMLLSLLLLLLVLPQPLLYLLLFHPLRDTHLGQAGLGLGDLRVPGVDRDLDVVPLLGVSLAGRPLDEGHPAAWGGADEGLLSRVKSPVIVESVPLGEGPLAELAGVLLHSRVHVHVVLEQ